MNPRLLPYTPERDAYRLLGVPPTASIEEIHAACRRLARTFHPDHNRSARATQEMQIVNVVRRVMTDSEERARYDRERWRFHTELMRPAGAQGRAEPPVQLDPPRPSPVRRYLSAVAVGMRAAVMGLTPPRCRGCRAMTEGDDRYCAACGTPLLTGV